MTAKRSDAVRAKGTAHLRTSPHLHEVKIDPEPSSMGEDFAVIVLPPVFRAVTLMGVHIDTLKTVLINTVRASASSAGTIRAALKEFVRKTVAEQP